MFNTFLLCWCHSCTMWWWYSSRGRYVRWCHNQPPKIASSAISRIFIAFAFRMSIYIRISKWNIYSHEVKIMMKSMKLFILNEIAVIYDSEQFFQPYLHEKSLLTSRLHFVNFWMMTLFSFFEFQKSLASWFLPYFLNPYELLVSGKGHFGIFPFFFTYFLTSNIFKW